MRTIVLHGFAEGLNLLIALLGESFLTLHSAV